MNYPYVISAFLQKHTTKSFSKSNFKTKSFLDYIHSDLWGHSRIKTFINCIYFLSLTIDYSRFVGLFYLNRKQKFLKIFKFGKHQLRMKRIRKLSFLEQIMIWNSAVKIFRNSEMIVV